MKSSKKFGGFIFLYYLCINKKEQQTTDMKRKITAEMIDWNAYRESIENAIKNESLWALGGSDFAEENIADLEEEIEAIDDEDYDFILDKYDDDIFQDFLK